MMDGYNPKDFYYNRSYGLNDCGNSQTTNVCNTNQVRGGVCDWLYRQINDETSSFNKQDVNSISGDIVRECDTGTRI